MIHLDINDSKNTVADELGRYELKAINGFPQY